MNISELVWSLTDKQEHPYTVSYKPQYGRIDFHEGKELVGIMYQQGVSVICEGCSISKENNFSTVNEFGKAILKLRTKLLEAIQEFKIPYHERVIKAYEKLLEAIKNPSSEDL